MKREEVYTLIEAERRRQDEKWRNEHTHPRQGQYKYFAPHILVIEEKLSRIRGLWYESASEQLRDELVKIAALAVRALEEVE